MNTDFAKGYRTLAFNGLTLLALVLGGLTGQIENPETVRYIAIAIVVINIILRFLTTGPVPSNGGTS